MYIRPRIPAGNTQSGGQPHHEVNPSRANNTLHLTGPHGSLTTEYKPLERDATKKPSIEPSSATVTLAPIIPQSSGTSEAKPQVHEEPQVDPSTLPVVTAPSTAPKIDLNKDGTMDGRSIYEVDIASLENKGWRRPGSDLSDWFNYGFDEISWEAYAVRRRDLGEMAPILKANVLVCWFHLPHKSNVLTLLPFKGILEHVRRAGTEFAERPPRNGDDGYTHGIKRNGQPRRRCQYNGQSSWWWDAS
jgi:hypothetical protein